MSYFKCCFGFFFSSLLHIASNLANNVLNRGTFVGNNVCSNVFEEYFLLGSGFPSSTFRKNNNNEIENNNKHFLYTKD